MNRNVLFDCAIHNNIFECPDVLVQYSSQFDEYSLIIHDGGNSTLEIYFCPWCGKKFPESKRDEWYLKDNNYEERDLFSAGPS